MPTIRVAVAAFVALTSLVFAQDLPPAPQPSIAPPSRVRVSQGVAQAFLVTKVQPVYPDEARKQHIEGRVLFKIIISREGDVKEVTLISGHPLLAPAAEEAVKQWKYKPYLLNNKPVEVETQVLVEFKLKHAGP